MYRVPTSHASPHTQPPTHTTCHHPQRRSSLLVHCIQLLCCSCHCPRCLLCLLCFLGSYCLYVLCCQLYSQRRHPGFVLYSKEGGSGAQCCHTQTKQEEGGDCTAIEVQYGPSTHCVFVRWEHVLRDTCVFRGGGNGHVLRGKKRGMCWCTKKCYCAYIRTMNATTFICAPSMVLHVHASHVGIVFSNGSVSSTECPL